jgi:hypothetical protein
LLQSVAGCPPRPPPSGHRSWMCPCRILAVIARLKEQNIRSVKRLNKTFHLKRIFTWIIESLDREMREMLSRDQLYSINNFNNSKVRNTWMHTSLRGGIGSGIESISLSFQIGFRVFFITLVFMDWKIWLC